jgi:ADP-ribosyl-[dinitrogen reductase] hydrolase
MLSREDVLGGLFGLCIGDALGLPVEGAPRALLKKKPVEEIGYTEQLRGVPPGWWSDDSSLSFCLAESLLKGFDLEDIANRFVRWLLEGYWTPGGKAFGIGGTTYRALERIRGGAAAAESGGTDEYSNGNGSLMRILPLAIFLFDAPVAERYRKTHLVSAITHAHPRSQVACGIFVELACRLLRAKDRESSYRETKEAAARYYGTHRYAGQLVYFKRILESDISACDESEIRSSGYVVDTLEASLFCFLNGKSYEDAVLRAVNLGGDTDTTGAVAGGLAGIFYGYSSIPERWIRRIARKDDILGLAERVCRSVGSE